MSDNIFLKVKDYTVSGEEFELRPDSNYDMLVTTPQPDTKTLSNYYKSEDYISHTDNKRNLFEIAYHTIRKISLSKKLRLIDSNIRGNKRLLDIGCGTGEFIAFAYRKGWSVTGIEPNERARAIAQSKVEGRVFEVNFLEDVEKASYDVVTLWHVLEHLPNLQEHINTFKHILAHKAYLIIAVPNYKSYDAQYYKSFWAAYDVPRHLWHFSRNAVRELMQENGFSLIEESPMHFDSFYVSLLSEKYKTGKMNILNAFRIGLLSNLKAKRTGEYSSIIYVFKNTNL